MAKRWATDLELLASGVSWPILVDRLGILLAERRVEWSQGSGWLITLGLVRLGASNSLEMNVGTAKNGQMEAEEKAARGLDGYAARLKREHIAARGSHEDYIVCQACSRDVLPDATCVCGWSFSAHLANRD